MFSQMTIERTRAGSTCARWVAADSMRTSILTVLVCATCLGQGAEHWKLNRQRSIFESGPAPKSETMTLSTRPEGLHHAIRRVLADGKLVIEDFVLPEDGQDHDLPGLPRCGTLRARKIDDLTSTMECRKDGKLLFISTRVKSRDGMEATVVQQGVTRDGRRFRNVKTWEREE